MKFFMSVLRIAFLVFILGTGWMKINELTQQIYELEEQNYALRVIVQECYN